MLTLSEVAALLDALGTFDEVGRVFGKGLSPGQQQLFHKLCVMRDELAAHKTKAEELAQRKENSSASTST